MDSTAFASPAAFGALQLRSFVSLAEDDEMTQLILEVRADTMDLMTSCWLLDS